MPTPAIASFAEKSGKSEAEVEKLWDKAKDVAAESGHTEDYAYITGILKKMLGLNEDEGPGPAPPEATSASTTTANVAIHKKPLGIGKEPMKRIEPDCLINGHPCFDVDNNDFHGMVKARSLGSRYPVQNEKVRQFMKENNYRKPYLIRNGDHTTYIKRGY